MTQYAIGTILLRVTGFSPEWHAPPSPCFEECEVVKHTPKGMWLKLPYRKKLKFQLNDGGRYASVTQQEAIQSFKHRRVRYIQILESKLEWAKQELQEASEWLARPHPELSS